MLPALFMAQAREVALAARSRWGKPRGLCLAAEFSSDRGRPSLCGLWGSLHFRGVSLALGG